MRAYAAILFQLLYMGEHGQQLEFVVIETEQHANAHIVDTGFHGSVHGVETIEEVLLAALEVHLFVGRSVVAFLKTLIGAYGGRLQQLEIFCVHGGAVDIDAADLTAFAFAHAVHGLDGVDYGAGVITRVLTVDRQDPFVAHLFQGFHLGDQLLLAQGLAWQVMVVGAEAAIAAGVGAVVGNIQGANSTMRLP